MSNETNSLESLDDFEAMVARLARASKLTDRTHDKIEATHGIETAPINDFSRNHDSEELGAVILILKSDDALEEDLAQMGNAELNFLSTEEKDEVLQNGFNKTIKTLGSYFSSSKLDFLFPNLDINRPSSYNLKDSRVRFFVLPREDYMYFYKQLQPGSGAVPGGFTFANVIENRDPDFKSRYVTNMSEKRVILLRESRKAKEFDFNDNVWEYVQSHWNARKEVSSHLEAVSVHELLHLMGIGRNLNNRLEEGLVEWYTRKVVLERPLEAADFEGSYVESIGYPEITEGLTIIFSDLVMSQLFTEDTISRAFLGEDRMQFNRIMNYLHVRFGYEAIDKIVNYSFGNNKEFLEYVKNLYKA